MTKNEKALFGELVVLLSIYLATFSETIDLGADIKNRHTDDHLLGDFEEAIELLSLCGIIKLVRELRKSSGDVVSVNRIAFSVAELREHVNANCDNFGVELDWLIQKSINIMSDYAQPLKGVHVHEPFSVPDVFQEAFVLLSKCGFSKQVGKDFEWTDKGSSVIFEHEVELTENTPNILRNEIVEMWHSMPKEIRDQFLNSDNIDLLGRTVANHWYKGKWHKDPIRTLSGESISTCWPAWMKALRLRHIANAPAENQAEIEYQTELVLAFETLPPNLRQRLRATTNRDAEDIAHSVMDHWYDGSWHHTPPENVSHNLISRYRQKSMAAEMIFELTGKENLRRRQWKPTAHFLGDAKPVDEAISPEQIWKTMPDKFRDDFVNESGEIDVLSLSLYMGHFFDGKNWHDTPESMDSLKRGDLKGGYLGIAREIADIFRKDRGADRLK